ncbi:hypothetical protein PCLA_09r0211 [Pseudomonas citronellolis]|nr:hypothetical protein PCLA_09r0211 [Pseudomonas citronellolis]
MGPGALPRTERGAIIATGPSIVIPPVLGNTNVCLKCAEA